ncbi:TPA: hypothetical protein ACX6QN_001625, partial [Photobacterium damselae]
AEAKTDESKEKKGNNKEKELAVTPSQEGKKPEEATVTQSNPILKKLEQIPDDTSELIRAQMILQARQRAQQQQETENSW